MKTPKLFIGPMSKNIVDSVVEITQENDVTLGLIPSRRQIECTGGYVNRWKTSEFANYVNKDQILLERDHGGPSQGTQIDYGFDSLYEDCKYFDILHVDPWKIAKSFDDGINETLKYLKFCYSINPNIKFEIGTEESIFKYEAEQLNELLHRIYSKEPFIFDNIVFVVIQSGTALKGINNIGTFSESRLVEMIKVCKSYNKLTKEHNGDYLDNLNIKRRFELGLDAINIAPEFGKWETEIILNNVKNTELFEILFDLCYDSNKWCKWVDNNFNPFIHKEELIKICGHYVFSDSIFKAIKKKFVGIDLEIKNKIKHKIKNFLDITND